MATQLLIEPLSLIEATIDSDNRTVRQKIIQAGMSGNNRNYPEAVLIKAANLFEGVKTYANHPSKRELRERANRSISDITGWLENVEYKDGALFATRHFAPTQAGQDSWKLAEMIVNGNAPATLMGASINAMGKGRKVSKGQIDYLEVEEITKAISVDDVSVPAAGGGFEPLVASADELTAAFFETLSYEEWFEAKPAYRKRLQRELKAIRQTDAVKAAEAEANQLRETLTTVQAAQQTLQAQLDAALVDNQSKTKALLVEKSLAKVTTLPASWKNSLRDRLMDADMAKWATIIDDEQTKAKSSGARPKVKVQGSGVQVAQPPRTLTEAKRYINWEEIDTPEKHAAVMQRIAKGEIKWQ